MKPNKDSVIDFLLNNEVDIKDVIAYLNAPDFGYFHFTNGIYYPEPIEGYEVDGVYIDNGFCISKHERKTATTAFRAHNFCACRKVELPDTDIRDQIVENSDELNELLRKIGWPELKKESYWAKNDKEIEIWDHPIAFWNLLDYGSMDNYVENCKHCWHNVRGVFKPKAVF